MIAFLLLALYCTVITVMGLLHTVPMIANVQENRLTGITFVLSVLNINMAMNLAFWDMI